MKWRHKGISAASLDDLVTEANRLSDEDGTWKMVGFSYDPSLVHLNDPEHNHPYVGVMIRKVSEAASEDSVSCRT